MPLTSAALSSEFHRLPPRAAVGAVRPSPACVADRNGVTLEYAIVSTRADFDALATEWDALFAHSGRGPQIFQSFGWCWHWCNHFLVANRTSLAIVTGRRAGRLVLVWPMVKERSAGLTVLSSLGAPVGQYSDALIEPSPEAQEQLLGAWESVVAAVKPDLVCMPRVRADAAIAPLMVQLGAMATRQLEAPYIDLAGAGDFDSYMRRHSVHSRKKFRAAARRLAGLGDVNFVEKAQSTAAAQLAADALDMKRRQLIERGLLSPAFTNRRLWDFFTDAARGGRHPTGVSIHALQVGGESAAANILLANKDCMLGHVFAYESRYAKDSAGAQLLQHTFKRAMEEGYRTFDLLAPADDYKMRCADGTVSVIDWAVPLTIRGNAYTRLYLKLARPLLKHCMERLPAAASRFLAQRYYDRS